MIYITKYCATMECQSWSIFDDKVPHNILGINLGVHPNWNKDPETDDAAQVECDVD